MVWTDKPTVIWPIWSDEDQCWHYDNPSADDTTGLQGVDEHVLEHISGEGYCEYCESEVVPDRVIIPSILMTMSELKALEENAFCLHCHKLVKTEPFSSNRSIHCCPACTDELYHAISIGTAIKAGYIVITD